ncbi:histone-fold-containing protein [Geopyxis carbonaria]|nr:histone-fold-containing protein [Geopyxis carbonaria]
MPLKVDSSTDSRPKSKPPLETKRSSIDEYSLPRSIVTRLAKSTLPQHGNLQKDVIGSLSEASTVFVNYLSSTANELACQHGRKTITPQDVMDALETLEYGHFVPRLQVEIKEFEGYTSKNAKKVEAEPEKEDSVIQNGEGVPHSKKLRPNKPLSDDRLSSPPPLSDISDAETVGDAPESDMESIVSTEQDDTGLDLDDAMSPHSDNGNDQDDATDTGSLSD